MKSCRVFPPPASACVCCARFKRNMLRYISAAVCASGQSLRSPPSDGF